MQNLGGQTKSIMVFSEVAYGVSVLRLFYFVPMLCFVIYFVPFYAGSVGEPES